MLTQEMDRLPALSGIVSTLLGNHVAVSVPGHLTALLTDLSAGQIHIEARVSLGHVLYTTTTSSRHKTPRLALMTRTCGPLSATCRAARKQAVLSPRCRAAGLLQRKAWIRKARVSDEYVTVSCCEMQNRNLRQTF